MSAVVFECPVHEICRCFCDCCGGGGVESGGNLWSACAARRELLGIVSAVLRVTSSLGSKGQWSS